MGFYRSFAGSVQVTLETPDIPECLRLLEREKIPVFTIRLVDTVTLELTASRKNLRKLQDLCQRKGYVLRVKQKKGLFWLIRSLFHRPVFLTGMVLLVWTAALLPGRILFISTEGNETVPSRFILESAEACGLKFWSQRREVRSEQIKNGLLEAIPQLQWVGVNTYGCRGVITVRERSEEPADDPGNSVSHIMAARDGVIDSCTVTRGSGNCTVGQAVTKGDILISGFTDCGLTITAERAEGEILAQTKRTVCVLTPATGYIQTETSAVKKRFSLLLGKKRINFYKGSGISGATCDKMYSKYVLTLPGGFTLPVALLKETTVSCSVTEAAVQNREQLLKDFAADYLSKQMTDGTILRRTEKLTETDTLVQLNGVYDCLENIGIVQEEKIGEFNGKTDGTDRERRQGG